MVGYLAPYLVRRYEVAKRVYFGKIMRKNLILVDSIFYSKFPTPYEYHKKFVSDWRTRLFFESWKTPYVYFTLTYDDEHLPVCQIPDKEGLQKFFKRFRRRLDYRKINVPFRYYIVSEYGDDFGRLHYHGLLFGIPFSHVIFQCFLDSWPFGRVDYKAGKPKDINYVTKYLHKRFVDRVHYLSLKSNGLGSKILSPEFIQRQRERNTNWFWFNGRRYYLPRYMMEKIFDKDERLHIYEHIKKQRLARIFKQSAKYPIGSFAYSRSDTFSYSSNNFVKEITYANDKYSHALAYLAYERMLDVERYKNAIAECP